MSSRPERLTRTADNCSLAAFRQCKMHFLKRGFLTGENQVSLWGAGPEGKAWHKLLRTNNVRVAEWIEVDRKKIGQSIHSAPVISYQQLTKRPHKILITVGSKGARMKIRDWCESRGLQETLDYICVT